MRKFKVFLALKGNIPALTLSNFISFSGRNMLNVVWEPFTLSLGATMSNLGWLRSIEGLTQTSLQAVTGRLSDRIGRKPMQVSYYILSIISMLIYLTAGTWLFLIPGVVLLLLDWHHSHHRLHNLK